MKLLCAGDLHIGRRPTRLPASVDCRPLSCARAWEAIVEYAVDQRVDILALSGDVVDQSSKVYEAVGPLERGLLRLREAGITTVAVAGNHDYDVLPQLARVIDDPSFRLLGAGGAWERTTVTTRGGETLHVDGWSFPAEQVRDNPLAGYDLRPDGDTPVLGLLHAELDVAESRYAPVPLKDLQTRPLTLWLLGHIHAPKLHRAAHGPPVLYPGSPQPMDPGEPGVHGVWLADLRPLAPAEPRQIPLASVRYAGIAVDVDGVESVDELHVRVNERLREGIPALVRESGGRLRYLSLRLHVSGATPLHRRIERELRNLAEDFEWRGGEASAYVERVTSATRPARDLEALSRGDDAVAVLARLAAALSSGAPDPDTESLLDATRGVAGTLLDARQYRSIDDLTGSLSEAATRAMAGEQALLLLDELLAQRELA